MSVLEVVVVAVVVVFAAFFCVLFLGVLEVLVLDADFVELFLEGAFAVLVLVVDGVLVELFLAGASAVAFVAVAVAEVVARDVPVVDLGVLGALGARGFFASCGKVVAESVTFLAFSIVSTGLDNS